LFNPKVAENGGWSDISRDRIGAAITRLAAAFPQTFGLEKHLAHRPLKIGIPADLRAALPELPSRVGQGTGRLCETHHVPAGAHGRRAARRSSPAIRQAR